jgi:ribosomal-protein-alanine N-acetyltransferase
MPRRRFVAGWESIIQRLGAGAHRPLRFRLAKPNDAPKFVVVEKAVNIDPWTEDDFRQLFASPNVHAFLTESNEVIGFVLWRDDEDGTTEVVNLATKQEAEGIGPLQLQAMLAAVEFTPQDRLRLTVRVSNEKAIGVYEHLGFTRVKEHASYWPNGETGVELTARVADLAFDWRIRAATSDADLAAIVATESSLVPTPWELDRQCRRAIKTNGTAKPPIATIGWHLNVNTPTTLREVDFALLAEYLGWDGKWHYAGYLYGFDAIC